MDFKATLDAVAARGLPPTRENAKAMQARRHPLTRPQGALSQLLL